MGPNLIYLKYQDEYIILKFLKDPNFIFREVTLSHLLPKHCFNVNLFPKDIMFFLHKTIVLWMLRVFYAFELGHIHEKSHEGTIRVLVIIKKVFWIMTTCLYPNMIVLLDITNNNSAYRDLSSGASKRNMKSFFYDIVNS